MEDRLLKIDQCFELIPIGKSTWWQRVASGELPQPVKLGTSTRWKHSELMAFIANLPAEPQKPARAA
jgi:prophage regulatory protein